MAAETAAEKSKRIKEEERKARIAARKAVAEKKAKEEAEERARREEQARLRWPVTRHLKSMLFKGAVIVNVTTIDQALLAQEAGATAISADPKSVLSIAQTGNVKRMPSPEVIKRYINTVLIPVFASVRVGHLMEAQVMESIGVNVVDESDLLATSDGMVPFSKRGLGVPTICPVSTLKDCLLRIQEGALMLRTKATPNSANAGAALVVLKKIYDEITGMRLDASKKATYLGNASGVYLPLLEDVLDKGRLPVLLFGSGGIHTASDAAMMMSYGCDGVFVDPMVFNTIDPEESIKNIIQAVKNHNNVSKICELSGNYI